SGQGRTPMLTWPRITTVPLSSTVSSMSRAHPWPSFLKLFRRDCLAVCGLIRYWARHAQMALDRPYDTAVGGAHAPRVGAGNLAEPRTVQPRRLGTVIGDAACRWAPP